MKKVIPLLLTALLLAGCASTPAATVETTAPVQTTAGSRSGNRTRSRRRSAGLHLPL